MTKAKHRVNGNGRAHADALLAPNLRAGARPGRSRPQTATDEDELTPFDAYRAVDAALRRRRDLDERIAIELGPLESMRFGNWTRSTLDGATEKRQSAKVEALRDEKREAEGVLRYTIEQFLDNFGTEPWWLAGIAECKRSLGIARAALAASTERLRLAQHADYKDATRKSAVELAQARAAMLLHEREIAEYQERARLLSAGRALAASYRQNLVDEDCRICCSPSVAAVNRDFSLTTAKHFGFRESEFEAHRPHVRQWMLRDRSVGMELVDAEGNRVDVRHHNGRS